MATYKVIQDIEAEDKLVGPLTLRQFIYAGIAAVLAYLSFLVITKGVGFLAIAFLPVCLAFAFLAFPWGRDQPTEIWALAKIRFLIKPRRRIWDQSGVKELVTITAPKQVVVNYTNGLSQNEVRSRLRALTDTLDSRGWAIKNANVNLFSQQMVDNNVSDRLTGPLDLPQQVSNVDIQASDDIMDEKNNPTAQKVDNLITQATKAHRDQLLERMRQPEPEAPPGQPKKPANNYWFLDQPGQPVSAPTGSVAFNTQVVTPSLPGTDTPDDTAQPTVDEENLLEQLNAKKEQMPTSSYYGHLKTIQPISAKQPPQPAPVVPTTPPPMMPPAMPGPTAQPAPPAPAPPPPPQVTPAKQAAILQLASNDDLNVATLAREAHRNDELQDEVVIKLH